MSGELILKSGCGIERDIEEGFKLPFMGDRVPFFGDALSGELVGLKLGCWGAPIDDALKLAFLGEVFSGES